MKLTELQKASRAKLKLKRKADEKVGKLKKTLMYIDIGHLDYDQWVAYRKNYIGGSDIATLITDEEGRNLNQWQSKLELFHEKVGVISKTGTESEATYSGHALEDHIEEWYWRYWDMENPTFEAMAAAKKANKPVRYGRKIKDKMMYDPKFPMIKINLDGLIQNTRFEKAPRGILEIKSGLGRIWNEYEAGIPINYILQVQTYMLVTGLKYAEIAVLLDGRYFQCFPIYANEAIQQKILDETKEFWDLVMEGRLIWEDNSLTHQEKLQLLSAIEPEVNGSAALDKYLKERFRSDYKAGQILVDDNIQQMCKGYLDFSETAKIEEEKKKLYSNTLKKMFLDNEVDEVVDEDGKVIVTNRMSTRGTMLRVNKGMKQRIKDAEEEVVTNNDQDDSDLPN